MPQLVSLSKGKMLPAKGKTKPVIKYPHISACETSYLVGSISC